ncbi:hypothetical protein OG462_44135 [Streptomyces sp. NBC_01077]|uniref:hypothetical protein n=1 Tax=Streptomyces sp. NBC_01077 TaxID=2903746 RepID=UPI00386E8FB1|nr:hypothetical protein OG462_00870 [Streptomyces sp. NBC_01077]WSV43715.1 hypothetical protein OG462_44135 [Streptomyces sp. NBC_01077]
MTVVIRLIGERQSVTWSDESSNGNSLRYFYELRDNGALLVHSRTSSADQNGHVQERHRIEVVYGPAAWLEVRGDH